MANLFKICLFLVGLSASAMIVVSENAQLLTTETTMTTPQMETNVTLPPQPSSADTIIFDVKSFNDTIASFQIDNIIEKLTLIQKNNTINHLFNLGLTIGIGVSNFISCTTAIIMCKNRVVYKKVAPLFEFK